MRSTRIEDATYQAQVALFARVDHATNTNPIAHFEFGHLFADGAHDTRNLVSRRNGVGVNAPITVASVTIRVTHATILDVNLDIVGSDFWAANLEAPEIGLFVKCA